MEKEKLFKALKGLLNIIDNSTGVDGHHLNGEVALWDEFEEVHYAKQVYKESESQNVSNNDDVLDALPVQHINNQTCPYCGNEYFQPVDEVTGMQYCFACKKVF